jgi:hypothetical protein
MSKKKRKFNSEVNKSTSLQLHHPTKTMDEQPDLANPHDPQKQLFSSELITRLAERIKKL